MLRKFVLASIAAASFGVALAGVSTPASAERWGGPRHGYSGYSGHGYGPPPWLRRHHWRPPHRYGPPAYHGRRDRHYGRSGPYRSDW